MLYLKIYAILGIIKIAASLMALCLTLLNLQGGIVALLLLVAIVAAIWAIVKATAKWGHLLYMVGIITDGALIAVAGSVMTGGGTGYVRATVLLAVLAVPLLIWSGLYRECWRQGIAFPGIKSW